VIPAYNCQSYVVEAIRSTLAQTRPPIECIIIDDGSTDGTEEVVRALGREVTYVRQPHSGVSIARNHGAERARGELVAFLDHDDIWLETKLERQLEALAGDDANMALCAMRVIDPAGNALGTLRMAPHRDLITGMLMFDGTETVSCSSTGVVRREQFLARGGFDPALSTSADWDLMMRTLLAGTIAYVDEPLVLYRLHDTNMSRDIGAMEREMRYAFAKALSDPRLPIALRHRKRHAYARLYRMLAGSYRDSGQTRAMMRTIALSIGQDPLVAAGELRRRLRRLARPA
jgi:glycosyltransferase involved in cell wall biosynthesis